MALTSTTGTSSTGSFTMGGLVSGMDTAGLIDKLVTAQSRSLTPLSNQKTALNNQLTAIQTINAKAIAMQVQAHHLATADTFNVTTGTSSDTTAVGVTAGSSAVPGTYTMTISSLARAEQQISQGFGATSDSVGTGTITLGLGSATFGAITIDSSNNTLQGVADAINKAGYGVSATIVNDGQSSANYHLVLTSSQTGASNTISFSNTLSGGTTPSFTVLQAAKDAEIKIGDSATGLTVTSTSNKLDDVIPGVTLNLLNETSTQVTIQVNADTTSVKSAINDFISSYNDTMDTIATSTSYDSATKTAAPLLGDATVLMLQQQLVGLATSTRSASSATALRSLADLGITMDGAGHLAVTDSTLLDNALANSLSSVKDFFTNSSTGLATRVDDYLTNATQASTGSLDLEQSMIQNQTTIITDSIAQQQASLDKYRASLELEFTAMETALSTIQAQSQYLTAYTSAQLSSGTANK